MQHCVETTYAFEYFPFCFYFVFRAGLAKLVQVNNDD